MVLGVVQLVLWRAATGRAEGTISGAQYNIPNWKIVGKSLPLQNNYFSVSSSPTLTP